MYTMAVSETYLDANPFHDVRTPHVPGRRAIKVATTEVSKSRSCGRSPIASQIRTPLDSSRVENTLAAGAGTRQSPEMRLWPALS